VSTIPPQTCDVKAWRNNSLAVVVVVVVVVAALLPLVAAVPAAVASVAAAAVATEPAAATRGSARPWCAWMNQALADITAFDMSTDGCSLDTRCLHRAAAVAPRPPPAVFMSPAVVVVVQKEASTTRRGSRCRAARRRNDPSKLTDMRSAQSAVPASTASGAQPRPPRGGARPSQPAAHAQQPLMTPPRCHAWCCCCRLRHRCCCSLLVALLFVLLPLFLLLFRLLDLRTSVMGEGQSPAKRCTSVMGRHVDKAVTSRWTCRGGRSRNHNARPTYQWCPA